jgi:hypothetical protein
MPDLSDEVDAQHPAYGIIWGSWIDAEIRKSGGDFALDDYQRGVRDGIRHVLQFAGVISRTHAPSGSE